MEFRQPVINNRTGLYRDVVRVADKVLAGRVLVLDPSCGSLSSLPGYAIYEAGVLKDSGVIEMPIQADLHRRLYYLRKCLTEQFPEKIDAVLYEDIPILRFNKFGRSLKGQVSLHYAVGVILSAFGCDTYLSIAPGTWRSFASEEHLWRKERGEASDESDAVVMGHALMRIAEKAKSAGPKKRKKKGRSTK